MIQSLPRLPLFTRGVLTFWHSAVVAPEKRLVAPCEPVAVHAKRYRHANESLGEQTVKKRAGKVGTVARKTGWETANGNRQVDRVVAPRERQ